MNKKSIKKSNYENKNVFIDLKKYLTSNRVDKYLISIFNYRVAMSIWRL